jgi:hypothetical protein
MCVFSSVAFLCACLAPILGLLSINAAHPSLMASFSTLGDPRTTWLVRHWLPLSPARVSLVRSLTRLISTRLPCFCDLLLSVPSLWTSLLTRIWVGIRGGCKLELLSPLRSSPLPYPCLTMPWSLPQNVNIFLFVSTACVLNETSAYRPEHRVSHSPQSTLRVFIVCFTTRLRDFRGNSTWEFVYIIMIGGSCLLLARLSFMHELPFLYNAVRAIHGRTTCL